MRLLISGFVLIFSVFTSANTVSPPINITVVSSSGHYVFKVKTSYGVLGGEKGGNGAKGEVFRYSSKCNCYSLVSSFNMVNDYSPNFIFVSNSGEPVTLGNMRSKNNVLATYSRKGKLIKSYSINDFLSEDEIVKLSDNFDLTAHWFCRKCYFGDDFYFEENKFIFLDYLERKHEILIK